MVSLLVGYSLKPWDGYNNHRDLRHRATSESSATLKIRFDCFDDLDAIDEVLNVVQ